MNEKEDNILDILQRPPKIYLDTNHLIHISNVRKGKKLPESLSEKDYNRLDEYIKACCGLIFNPYAALEWIEGNATVESARELAAVIDTAKVKYVIDADYITYTNEILNQCIKQNINIPDLPPILQNISDSRKYNSALGILINQVPAYLEKNKLHEINNKGGFPITIQHPSAQDWTEESFYWKKENLEIYQERIHGFKALLSEDISRRNEYFIDPDQYRKEWLKRFLKIDKILEAFNPGIDVDNILEKIDINNCPAVNLYWIVREKRMKSGNRPEDNDVDDYGYIHVIPYVDVVLIEKQLRAFVLQADESLESRIFARASDAINALENQGFTW